MAAENNAWFDFDQESKIAAVNEACSDNEEVKDCSIKHLCPSCENLSKQIKARLYRAFLAGQNSVIESRD